MIEENQPEPSAPGEKMPAWREVFLYFLVVACLIICFPALAFSTFQDTGISEERRATVDLTQSRITIDGLLNEPDWLKAVPVSEILQREPKPGEKATEQTEVRLLYDSANLYIGVMCYDLEPSQIIGTQMARDADLSVDDRIEIVIDTYRDRRNGFYFATNPLGALVDGLIIENGQLNREWDAIWEMRTRRVDRGWIAEFAIPFKSLGFNKGEQPWGFNFSRTIKRKIEEDRWASPRLDVKLLQVSEAGEISGFTEIEQGRGLDVRPFVSGKPLHTDASGNDVSAKAGVDIFYNINPNLKWTTTINTDFAETEVDNRQINLTRFPLFFPEKRAFFLENTGVFNFGFTDGSSDILPFFSRRIGLLEGKEVPILAGTKLTGTAGPYNLGVLAVRTRASDFVDPKGFVVGRVKRSIFKQSYIGGIYTEGNPADNRSSRTFGGDLRVFTSRFRGREQTLASKPSRSRAAMKVSPGRTLRTVPRFFIRMIFGTSGLIGDTSARTSDLRSDSRREPASTSLTSRQNSIRAQRTFSTSGKCSTSSSSLDSRAWTKGRPKAGDCSPRRLTTR